MEPVETETLLELTVQIVSAYVARSSIQVADLPTLITSTHSALAALSAAEVPAEETAALRPAVPIKKSVTPEFIICLEDGRSLKMLKRHLLSKYKMTPDEYRQKWGLPKDYPMVAPNYASRRSDMAHKIGLGKKTK